MNYLINDVILLLTVVLLVYFLRYKRYEYAIVIMVVAYFCAPVIKFKDSGINPAYLFTGIISIWVMVLLLKKQVKFSGYVKWFIAGSGINLTLVVIAWLINAQCVPSHIIHFLGMFQYILGVVALCILYSMEEYEQFVNSFYKGIQIAVMWNFTLTILQMFVPKIGIFLTQLFYSYQGKDVAISYTKKVGRFLRAFGGFYSSTVTGGFCLFVLAFILFIILKRENWKKELKFFFMALFVGLFAFSKAVILGIFLLFIILIGLMFILKTKKPYKRIIVCFGVTIGTFCTVALLGNMIGLTGQVNYYFGKIFSPLSALETRYGDVDANRENGFQKEESEKGESEEGEIHGNLEKTIEVIKDNFIIGVGPAPIRGEFVGDSQYIVTLHDGGIINLMVYIGIYLSIFVVSLKNKNLSRCLLIAVVALEGVFIPVFLYSYAIPFIAFCFMITKEEEKLDEKVCVALL